MGGRLARWCLACVVALALALVPAVAIAMPSRDGGGGFATKLARIDDRPSPLAEKREALRDAAIEKVAQGAANGNKHDPGVFELAEGQFVDIAFEGEDAVWTVLGEFPDLQHNTIAKPDPTFNNSTYWVSDFSRDFFKNMLFAEGAGANSMRAFFLEQSSGRYAVKGDVTDWVTVPNGFAYYDDNKGNVDTSEDVWLFLADSVDGWYQSQLGSDKTPAEIEAYLSQFDVWDRYDYDGDGDFNEPDGYIDHFQSLHAGEGEEGGGGSIGAQAIWSHSWYANYGDYGDTGPDGNLAGGVQVGESTYWIGDYTIQPENGGVGVFVHEFTHDLGIPDLYDTSGGENGTGFWTLMSSGSWLDTSPTSLGNVPGHLGAWEKYNLGWLDPVVVQSGTSATVKLGPSEYNSDAAQAVRVSLPKKTVNLVIAAPYAGSKFYYSDSGDDLRNSMYRTFSLSAGAALTAKVNYGIEEGYDYAALVVSEDGGATWDIVPTSISNSSVVAGGIDGFSGGWVALSADLSEYSGDVLLGFQYVTDGGVAEFGFCIDELSVTGYPVDGAEAAAGWTFDGFRTTTGSETAEYAQYYLAEVKSYWGYDKSLEVGPYNFGFLNNPLLGNWVEHFPYQDGLLVWYVDESQKDNNTSVHPGRGMCLPVDAHPKAMMRPNGAPWRARVQMYDATFGFEATDALRLHYLSKPSPIPSLAAVSTFNDLNSYWDKKAPLSSVITPKTGTQIKILSISKSKQFMNVQVSSAN